MMNGNLLQGLWSAPNPDSYFYGVTVGLVTNNQDPDNMGRVKVKFPWLSEEHESNWARVLSPMAGPQRGMYFLPEVDDEVLVAFEHGQVEFPYILGSLWNGKDAPPEKNEDGKNNKRVIRSRSGHLITLDDTDGAEKIIICDKTGKNEIAIDSTKNSLTIKVEGDFIVEAKGKISLKSNQELSLESQADVKLKGVNLALEGSSKAELKGAQISIEGSAKTEVKGTQVSINGSAQTEVKGTQVSINGNAQTEVKGGAMVQIQGGIVMIN